jgi:hypothetical protein
MSSKKVCIFCSENRKLSKEHLWPEWIRNRISRQSNDKYLNEIYLGEAKQPMSIEKSQEKNGNLATLKFRVVCEVCNNGWMSQLEEKVQPFFELALSEQIGVVDEAMQRCLAEWIAMKIMVAEQSDGKTMVTPPSDLNEFYLSRLIPRYYRIYVGKHDLENNTEYMRHSCTLSRSTSGPKASLGGLEKNAQSVALIFGRVLIYVVACREEDIKLWQRLKLNELKLIYPQKAQISWASVKTTRNNRVTDIAHGLPDLIRSNEVLYGGNNFAR